ncbi:MAG: hypothetical protein WC373_04850 [Smithella sp.]|jgi:hypothetical protein
MSYELEMREEERRLDQEWRMPKSHGDIVTEDDILLWEKRKIEMEVKDSNKEEWNEMNRRLDYLIK